MSRLKLRLSPLAEADLRGIRRSSLKVWGLQQTDRYMADISRSFKDMCERPERGRPRTDVAAGYRSWLVGQHIIFYQLTAEEVQIIAILHQRMDSRNL